MALREPYRWGGGAIYQPRGIGGRGRGEQSILVKFYFHKGCLGGGQWHKCIRGRRKSTKKAVGDLGVASFNFLLKDNS